jgi:hypothetical protein
MKRTTIFFILLLTLASCKKLYQCSCNETTTYLYIPGEPASYNASSYIEKGKKKKLEEKCKNLEVSYEDSVKTIVTKCSLTEE